jgi:hypothetical protein
MSGWDHAPQLAGLRVPRECGSGIDGDFGVGQPGPGCREILRMDLGQPDGINVADELARDRSSER